jgi:tetratricopeptide (TPR) repeat protein
MTFSMSGNRRDPHKARLRRDRIRQEKNNQPLRGLAPRESAPRPLFPHFAAERSLYQVQALLEGQHFENADEANARLAELTAGGRLSELADAWKQDDPKWRAQSLAYDALETDDIMEALRLVTEAQKLDPLCTDAQRLMVSLLPSSLENRLHLMREVVETAERNMGPTYIAETIGHFWGTVTTRPYMRAKQHLGELLVESEQLTEAIEVFERMLELNSRDDQGMRYRLLGLYLATDQPDAADRLLSSYEGEEEGPALVAWGRVLERWLSGNLDEARAALARARKVNPFAESYISGERRLPEESPEYYRPGDETEAQVCAKELGLALESHPDFRDWVRTRGNR